MKENQTLYRYEFKYMLNKKLSDRIEEEARNFMSYDGFVSKSLNNKYIVRSLYFDNNFSSNFYEKADGMKRSGVNSNANAKSGKKIETDNRYSMFGLS